MRPSDADSVIAGAKLAPRHALYLRAEVHGCEETYCDTLRLGCDLLATHAALVVSADVGLHRRTVIHANAAAISGKAMAPI